ncbi:hypothetical protein ACOMHN_018578 [Nucella lapillus]
MRHHNNPARKLTLQSTCARVASLLKHRYGDIRGTNSVSLVLKPCVKYVCLGHSPEDATIYGLQIPLTWRVGVVFVLGVWYWWIAVVWCGVVWCTWCGVVW